MASVTPSFPGGSSPHSRPGSTDRPRDRRSVRALPATGGRRGEYALADVARPLNMLHLARRTLIAHLRALARHEGMPLPKNPRVVRGETKRGPECIWKESRWDAGEFDAWLNGRGPAPVAAAPAPDALRAHLAANAARLARGAA